MWFHLVDEATGGAFLHHKVSSGSSGGVCDIDDLRKKIRSNYRREEPDILAHIVVNQLDVYANRKAFDDEKAQPLDPRPSLSSLDAQDTQIVVVPTQHLVPRTVAPAAELMEIPSTIGLTDRMDH